MAENDSGSGGTPHAVTPELMKEWFATDEGKVWWQPQIDSAVGKAITTHDEKRQPDIDKALADKDAKIGELEKAAKDTGLTVEQQLAQMRAQLEKDKREMEVKEAGALLREKQLQWRASAVKKGLPETTFVDPSLSVEDGEKYLDTLKTANDEAIKAGINKGLGGGTPPGSGNEPDASKSPDRTGWTDAQYNAEAQKKLDELTRSTLPEHKEN